MTVKDLTDEEMRRVSAEKGTEISGERIPACAGKEAGRFSGQQVESQVTKCTNAHVQSGPLRVSSLFDTQISVDVLAGSKTHRVTGRTN